MVRKLLILGMCLIAVGCATQKTPNIVYKEVKVPIYIVPKPPVVERPTLSIETITPEQQESEGELAKAYKLTIKELQQYAEILELVIAKYDEVSGEYEFKPDLSLPPVKDQ